MHELANPSLVPYLRLDILYQLQKFIQDWEKKKVGWQEISGGSTLTLSVLENVKSRTSLWPNSTAEAPKQPKSAPSTNRNEHAQSASRFEEGAHKQWKHQSRQRRCKLDNTPQHAQLHQRIYAVASHVPARRARERLSINNSIKASSDITTS